MTLRTKKTKKVTRSKEHTGVSRAPRSIGCHFCKSRTSPSYKDAGSLAHFTTDRGKIVSRLRSGVCAKHQRMLSQAIKRARHLALLPFVVRPE